MTEDEIQKAVAEAKAGELIKKLRNGGLTATDLELLKQLRNQLRDEIARGQGRQAPRTQELLDKAVGPEEEEEDGEWSLL